MVSNRVTIVGALGILPFLAQVVGAPPSAGRQTHRVLVPPLLDAWAAYQVMNSARNGEIGLADKQIRRL